MSSRRRSFVGESRCASSRLLADASATARSADVKYYTIDRVLQGKKLERICAVRYVFVTVSSGGPRAGATGWCRRLTEVGEDVAYCGGVGGECNDDAIITPAEVGYRTRIQPRATNRAPMHDENERPLHRGRRSALRKIDRLQRVDSANSIS